MGSECVEVIIACDDSYGLDVHTIICEISKQGSDRPGKYYKVLGFICDNPTSLEGVNLPAPLLGAIANWHPDGNARYAMAIRDPGRKEEVATLLESKGAVFETFIAPWVLMPDEYKVGRGCVIANYNFKHDSRFGNYVTIDSAMCESVTVGDYSTLCPYANITSATIGARVYVGTHVAIMPGKAIGDDSYLHAGSVVVSNVKPKTKVAGVPGKRLR